MSTMDDKPQCARSLMDKATASGAVDWRFESSRAQ